MARDNSELIDVNSDNADGVMEVSHLQSLIYYCPARYNILTLTGELDSHLAAIDEQAQNQMDRYTCRSNAHGRRRYRRIEKLGLVTVVSKSK